MDSLEAGRLPAAPTEEKLDVHLRDGTVITVTVDEDDADLNKLDDQIEDWVGGAPRWVWIGTAYVFNRAVAAIAYAAEDPFSLEVPGLQAT